MKNLKYQIPFIGKILLRLDAAISIIMNEWGDNREEAIAMIDSEARELLKPKQNPAPAGEPFSVQVNWARHAFHPTEEEPPPGFINFDPVMKTTAEKP